MKAHCTVPVLGDADKNAEAAFAARHTAPLAHVAGGAFSLVCGSGFCRDVRGACTSRRKPENGVGIGTANGDSEGNRFAAGPESTVSGPT